MREFSEHEKKKIEKMVINGATKEGAEKTRVALRRKKKVEQVSERERDAVH